ncbi:MAG: hypothetical protein JXL80_14455 [Planctomycetes bacterium]|nr:hypothetical protein [Planctomycetota bacterium]
MNRRSAWLIAWVMVLASLAVVGAGGCKTSPPEEDPNAEPTGPYAELDKLLPRLLAMPAWKFDGPAQHYADVTRAATDPGLSDLAASDVGASDAALFQECGYKMSVVRKYKQADTAQTMTVAIHEMNDGDAAFAVFSVLAQGKPVSGTWLAGKEIEIIGVGGAGSAGAANTSRIVFVKGRYVVTVDHRGAAVSGSKPVADLVAQNIFSGTLKPALVRELPTSRMVQGSEFYVTGQLGLDRAKKQLGLTADLLTPAVLGSGTMALATYESAEGKTNTIFAIRYPSSGAQAAEATLKAALVGAAADVANSLAFEAVGSSHLVGTLTPEEESVQQILPDLIANLGG